MARTGSPTRREARSEVADDTGTPEVPLVCEWHEGKSPSHCRYREMTSFLTASLELDELIASCVAFVHNLVRARSVRIWLLRRSGRRLVSREMDPDAESGYREVRLVRGRELAWAVVEGDRTLRLGPSRDEPRFRDQEPGWEAALAVPIRRRGRVLGVVECRDRAEGGEFREAERRALEEIVGEFGVAIENAQLYFDTRRRATERAVLLEVSRALSQPQSLEATLEAILDGLGRVVRYDAAAIFLLSADTLQIEAESTRGYAVEGRAKLQMLLGEGVVGWVAKTGESTIVSDTRKDTRYHSARSSTRSEMACPLLAGGSRIGVFNLESDRTDAYTEAHLELLEAFATQAAASIERARLLDEARDRQQLERELSIAREIQTSFLPKSDPEIEGFDIAGLNLPFSEVGGDYFDFIPVLENQIAVAISDVAGKGVPAALLMAAFRASLLAEIRNQFTLRTIFAKVNTLLHESTDRGKFVTAFCGLLDVKHRVFTFVNGGHNPPILRRRDGSIELLMEGGLALGVLPTSTYEERPVHLEPGDVLLLYTDGVNEASDEEGEQFGTERLEALLAELHDRSARQIVDAILDRVIRFVQGPERLPDDLTVVCLKSLEAPPG